INFPSGTNELFSNITKIPVPTIIKLKKVFLGKDEKEVLKATQKFFSKIPNLKDPQRKELDAFALQAWQRLQETQK
ncbi:MAG: hypothetical protein AAF960_16240, partial [Bacteroidota bacterium]